MLISTFVDILICLLCIQNGYYSLFLDFFFDLIWFLAQFLQLLSFKRSKWNSKICRCLFLNCNICACKCVYIFVCNFFEQVSFLRIKCNNGKCSCTTNAEVDMFIYIVVHTSLLISFSHAIFSWLLIIPIKYKVNQPEKTFTFCL